MDLFAQQARVRGSSRRLVVLFLLAVVAIVLAIDAVVWFALGHHANVDGTARSDAPLLAITSIVVICGIALSSLYRIASLSEGGKKVAQTLGAVEVPTDTADPQLRQLRNVIEEVAIAAGVPVPDIYLMADEPGINAFAAGYSPSDATVCVTQGCLDQLSRDELQGVIAHEFSHVVNGDMRLNIRLMGLLFGILVLAVVGRQVIWFGSGRSSRRDSGGGGQVWMIGLALIVVGYIGYFFARLIQAAVSRSRESLADVSAVQFTRQTDGIANALKKIAISSDGSLLQAAHKHEVAHMLFGEADSFNSLFATHPPLLERIRALQPGFREEDLAQFATSATDTREASPALAARSVGAASSARDRSSGGVMPLPVLVAAGAAAAAGPAPDRADSTIDRAVTLRRNLPEALTSKVQDPEAALVTVLALALSTQAGVRERQLRLLADAFGDDVQHATVAMSGDVESLSTESRLPLVALATPALKRLSPGRLQTFLDALDAVVRVDSRVDLGEYCLTRLLRLQLLEAQRPRSAPVDGRSKLPACRDSVKLVYAVVADKGNSDPAAAHRAWLLAIQDVFPGEALDWPALPDAWQESFEAALNELDGLLPAAKELLIQGLVIVVRADAVVSAEELELLRVICASVHCPLPL